MCNKNWQFDFLKKKNYFFFRRQGSDIFHLGGAFSGLSKIPVIAWTDTKRGTNSAFKFYSMSVALICEQGFATE